MGTGAHSQVSHRCVDGSFSKANAHSLDPIITSLIVLGFILAVTSLRTLAVSKPIGSPPAALASINPNTAPWWELMVLPDIGETTARKIVEFREANSDQASAFRNPADLEPVPGIGPKTIQRIAPNLRFSD